MEQSGDGRSAVRISILIVALVFITICAAAFVAGSLFGLDPPDSSGEVTTVVSTISGAFWFRRKLGRPMGQSERLRFAAGVTLINAVVPAIIVGVFVEADGLPLNLDSYDAVLAGGKGFLLEPMFAFLMLILLGLTFVEAYFFGWLITRKPRRSVDR